MPAALRAGSFVLKKTLIPHQNANFINLLPFVLKGEDGADFKEAGGDINGLGDLAPVMEVFEDLPVLVAVIYDEQLTAGQAGAFGHGRSFII